MSALFPFGTADASRVLNICRLLKHEGHEVIVFCDCLSDPNYKKSEHEAEYEGIKIHYSYPKRTLWYKLTNTIKTPSRINRYISNHKIDLIIASHAESRFRKILSIAQRHRVPLVLESNEKYHYTNWTLGKFDYRYYQFLMCWNKYYLKSNGVIAISSFLEKYYIKHSLKVFCMPTIIDVDKIEPRIDYEETGKIKIVFSGGLGKGKDRLKEIIEAISQCEGKTKRQLVLSIYGPSKNAIEAQLGDKAYLLDKLKDSIIIGGRIPQQEVLKRVKENDFGIILRPNRESSNAGFPTKLAEYMSVGTPVIANRTSDLGKYITPETGVIFDELTVENVISALQRISSLSKEELTIMRYNTRRMAEESFDYRLYSKPLIEFIGGIIEKNEN